MNSRNEIPKLVRDLIYGNEHHLFESDVGRAVTQLMRHGVADDLVRSLIQNPVKNHKIAQAFQGPFEAPHLNHGNLIQGIDQRERSIRIPIQFLNGHSLTVGGTGSGKTTKSRFLILQIANRVKGLWCFDFVKREFSILKPYLARMGIELVIVPAREIRLNPLQCPEHVSPADWAPRIADILVQTLDLPPRATKKLHVTIVEMYHRFGIFGGGKHYPILLELRETIAADREANHPAKQAILDSLDPVLMSIGGGLHYRVGWTTKDLANKHIVFELGGTAEVDKNLILNSIVLTEFTSRIAQGISNPDMDLLIVLDEAGRLVSSSNQSGGIADLIGLVRGTGIGLDLSTQSSDVAHFVISNTANKIIGRCGSATDYDMIGAAMGLTREQRRWLNTNLRPGLFVGQIGEGGWRQPFVFEIPKMKLKDFGTTPDAEKSEGGNGLKDLMDLPTVVADEFINWRPDRSKSTRSSTPEAGSVNGLSDAELRYLKAVISYPGRPSSELPKLSRMSAARAQNVRRRLIERGFLREHRVSTGSRGRASIILEPLEPALKATRDMRSELTS